MTIVGRSPLPLLGTRLSVGYGNGDVVSGVDVRLIPGRVTALVGPNGSGKSTLLRGLSRLQRLSSGTVELDEGVDASTLTSRDFARRVGMLAQSRPTPAGLTVRDAVEFGRHPHRSRWRGQDEGGPEAVDRALALAGIHDLRQHTLDTLSGGQMQRVWFASALAQDTAILLLDEPTNHLDLRYQVEVLELIRDLADRHGVTIGVVLHDLNHAGAVADQVVVMNRGRVAATGTPREAFTADLLSAVYEIEIEIVVDSETGVPDVRVPRQRRRSLAPAIQ